MNTVSKKMALIVALGVLPPVSSAKEDIKPVQGKELKALVEGAQMRTAANVTHYFGQGGEYRAEGYGISSGSYKVGKENVCIFVGGGQDRCLELYRQADGSLLAIYFRGGAKVASERVDFGGGAYAAPGR